MSNYAHLCGELAAWPPRNQMVRILKGAGLAVRVGTYSVRIENCSHFVFQEYGGNHLDPDDPGSPLIDADANSVSKMMMDAGLVSAALAAANLAHRFEVLDVVHEMQGYHHHDWPLEATDT